MEKYYEEKAQAAKKSGQALFLLDVIIWETAFALIFRQIFAGAWIYSVNVYFVTCINRRTSANNLCEELQKKV